MKHLSILSLLLLGFSSILIAQPVLYQVNHEPSLGDVEYRNMMDSSLILPGASGAAMTWDFSSLSFSGVADTINYQAVPAHHASLFSPANRAWNFGVSAGAGFGDNLGFDYQNSDSVLFRGWIMDGPILDPPGRNYDDPALTRLYPISYLDSWTDTISGYSMGFASLPFSGTYSVMADGYGQLILASDTFQNVIRLHHTESSTNTINLLYDEKYEFISADYKFPILTVQYLSGTQSVYASEPELVTGLFSEPNTQSLGLYPNPARATIQIRSLEKLLSIGILDIQGRELKLIKGIHSTETSIDIMDLPAGIYWIRIHSENGKTVRKFLKR